MNDQLIDYKIYQLTNQVDRMTSAVDKLCYRIELLEIDFADRKLKKKIIGFLFTLYPIVMLILTLSINFDQNRLQSLLKQYASLVEYEMK